MDKDLGKVKLQFMVDPDWLRDMTIIDHPIKVKVIRPDLLFLTGLLGESGREMVKAGFPFWFEGSLALELIDKGICKRIE